MRSDSKARAGYPRLSGEASGASPAGCLFGECSRTQLHAWSVAGLREHHCYPHTWESSVQVGLAERTTGPWMAFPTAWPTAPESRCRSLGCVWSCVLATLLALGDHARILQAPFHPVAAHQAAPELCAGLTPGTRRASIVARPRSQYPSAKGRNTQIPQAPVNTQPTECRPC